jgi:hypothetical protein
MEQERGTTTGGGVQAALKAGPEQGRKLLQVRVDTHHHGVSNLVQASARSDTESVHGSSIHAPPHKGTRRDAHVSSREDLGEPERPVT